MARRGGPALYELLGSAREGEGRARTAPRRNALFETAHLRTLLVWVVVIAAVIAALSAAYVLGARRGGRDETLESPSGQNLPLNAGSDAARVSENSPVAAPTTAELVPSVTASTSTTLALPKAADGVDPRQQGLHFFVLASTLEPNAVRLVAFCRERGLDAYVVPDHNGRLREVTVLPGFELSERSGPVIKQLEERIRQVGVLWKASGPGNSDFGDRYHKLFKKG